jgi:hypothetical protein
VGASEWNRHVPVLRAAYPNWRFEPANGEGEEKG